MEGDRFFDLVRWGVAAETMNSYIGVEQKQTRLLSWCSLRPWQR